MLTVWPFAMHCFHQMPVQCLEDVARALSKNSRLTSLYIEGCMYTRKEVMQLMSSPTISVLSITQNELSMEIYSMIGNNSKLRYIAIAHSGVGPS